MRAIRAEVGTDFHLQAKISATEYGNAFFPWAAKGNTIEDSVQVCRWLEEAGVDAIHVSAGNAFPHPRNPAGAFSAREVVRTYDTMLSNGRHTLRNYLMFRIWPLNRIAEWRWSVPAERVEGANLPDAHAIKEAVAIPVLCTRLPDRLGYRGGARARRLRRGHRRQALAGEPDLVPLFAAGHERPPRPCTYCNKCLFNVLEHPVGCYDESRYGSREEMIREIFSVFAP